MTMARWNRREKPDYSHLRGLADDAALVNAIRCPTYGGDYDYSLHAGFQARLVAMWGDRDVIPLAYLVAVHEAVRAVDTTFFGHGRNWTGAFLYDAVGNIVGWGLRLGILAEVVEGGDRAFRMLRRDPLYEQMGNGQWRKLDADGVRERSARGAAQRESYRIRHAESIAADVLRAVGGMCEKGAAIPEGWFRFPEFAPLKGLAERVADARTTFENAHLGMHLAAQKAWVKRLVIDDGMTSRKQPSEPVAAVILDEDADALGSMA